MPTAEETAFRKGLPANIEAEQFVLGSILLDPTKFPDVATQIGAPDFNIGTHRRIFTRITELFDEGRTIEYISLCDELERHAELEAVGGIAYIASLTDGLPNLANIDSYIGVVREKSQRRRLAYLGQEITQRAIEQTQPLPSVLEYAERGLQAITQDSNTQGLMSPREIIDAAGGVQSVLDPSKNRRGLDTGFLDFDERTGGLYPGNLILVAARPSMGKNQLRVRYLAALRQGKPSRGVLLHRDVSGRNMPAPPVRPRTGRPPPPPGRLGEPGRTPEAQRRAQRRRQLASENMCWLQYLGG